MVPPAPAPAGSVSAVASTGAAVPAPVAEPVVLLAAPAVAPAGGGATAAGPGVGQLPALMSGLSLGAMSRPADVSPELWTVFQQVVAQSHLQAGGLSQASGSARPTPAPPSPRMPDEVPPVGEAAMRELVSQRGSHASLKECWQVFQSAALHTKESVKQSWEDVFHPRGYTPRDPEVVLEWVEGEAREAIQELSESFAERRLLATQLEAANHRARDAISRAAWLYCVRARARSTNPDYLGRDD